jgi:hypothetical protein
MLHAFELKLVSEAAQTAGNSSPDDRCFGSGSKEETVSTDTF